MVKLFSCFCVVLSGFNAIAVRGQYFTDKPPVDYFHRESLADCSERFYSNPNRFNWGAIYGGQRAVVGEFQHMVAIGWPADNGEEYACGGSLLTSKFVMTAAHCMARRNGNVPNIVRLGDTNLGGDEDVQFRQLIKIKTFKIHPQYRFNRKYYDIALIELETEVEFSEGVCPACLWLEQHAPMEPMTAVGFGTTGFGEDLSLTLQKATLKAISNEKCMERISLNRRSSPQGLLPEQFCAASDYQDTCQGDSGGPLQVERVDMNGDVIPLIVGVVSFGAPCSNGSAGVYTRVAPYKKWIEQELGRSMDYLECSRKSKCFYRRKNAIGITSPPPTPIHRVGLLWNKTDRNVYECGGTIIDYRFVLTSAFCAITKRGYPEFVVVENIHVGHEVVPIEEIHLHPMYQKAENDIAMLKLSKYLDTSGDVQPACLWRERKSPDFDKYLYDTHNIKLKVSIQFSANSDGRYLIYPIADENGTCVGEIDDRNFLCQNNSINLIPQVCKLDYGGPVLNSDLFNKTPYLYGVVSTLSKSCSDNLIGIRLYQHVEWIESIVLGDSSDRLIFSS